MDLIVSLLSYDTVSRSDMNLEATSKRKHIQTAENGTDVLTLKEPGLLKTWAVPLSTGQDGSVRTTIIIGNMAVAAIVHQ